MRFEICDAVDASGAYDSDCFHRNYYPGFIIGGMHPVNNFWLKDTNIDRASNRFFSFISVRRVTGEKPDWKELRNRWEYSHVVRAGLGLAGLLLVVTAVAL